MAETDVDPSALEGFASRLRGASTTLESTPNPPDVPEAGEASGLLASMLSHLTTSLDGAVVGHR
jgi:hypothetical protein